MTTASVKGAAAMHDEAASGKERKCLLRKRSLDAAPGIELNVWAQLSMQPSAGPQRWGRLQGVQKDTKRPRHGGPRRLRDGSPQAGLVPPVVKPWVVLLGRRAGIKDWRRRWN